MPLNLTSGELHPQALDEAVIQAGFDAWQGQQWSSYLESQSGDGSQRSLEYDGKMTMGYVTHDDCSGLADDIEHYPGKPFQSNLVHPILTTSSPIWCAHAVSVLCRNEASDKGETLSTPRSPL